MSRALSHPATCTITESFNSLRSLSSFDPGPSRTAAVHCQDTSFQLTLSMDGEESPRGRMADGGEVVSCGSLALEEGIWQRV